MVDTVISDAAVFPQDEGVGSIVDGNETWDSAGLLMMLAQAVDSDSYARSDSELDFAGHDATNDTVDVNPGVAYLSLTGETVSVQSSLGGPIPPAYDTTLPTLPAICVVVPTEVTVQLQASTASQVWLAYATDGTVTGVSAGDVYLRSDDTGSVTAPPHPSVELGSANPDNASGDSLLNRFGSPTFLVEHTALSDAHHTRPTQTNTIKTWTHIGYSETSTGSSGSVTLSNHFPELIDMDGVAYSIQISPFGSVPEIRLLSGSTTLESSTSVGQGEDTLFLGNVHDADTVEADLDSSNTNGATFRFQAWLRRRHTHTM